MSPAILTINSHNFGAWSMRTWLLCRMAGLDFTEVVTGPDDPATRAELLQLSPSFLVPCLEHDGIRVWDTLAIAEYLNELLPDSALLPVEPAARAHCRSICGELHSGFHNLRSALPMNVRRRHREFKVWTGAQADIDRVVAIWSECLARYGGPWLFGDRPTMADALYVPECTRFVTYGLELEPVARTYVETVLGCAHAAQWIALAADEPDELSELDAEF